ncbi:hypothetical protein D3C85_1703350 [compost metagenome]
MFKEATQDGTDPYVFAESRHAGAQGADAANHDVNLYAGLRGPVEGIDDGFVHHGVDLDLHPG